MLDNNLQFDSFHFDSLTIEALDTFNYLEKDQYLQSEFPFRERAFSTAIVSGNQLTWSGPTSFYQDKNLNQYAGGIDRFFQPLCDAFRNEVVSLILSQRNERFFSLNSYEIGVHQLRILCEDDQMGYPVPEGPHQDGFDFVAIHCMNIFNTSGGVTSLFSHLPDGELVFQECLNAGQGVIVDDREIFHYTSPISSIDGTFGCRDMCVITYKRIL